MRQHHRWREAGVIRSPRWTHGDWPWVRPRTQAFCPLHRTISVKGWGMKHSGWSPLQRLSSWLWNTSLSWLPSYLPGCSFSVYPFLLYPHCYSLQCLPSGPSCSLHMHSLWVIQSWPMTLRIIFMLRHSNFHLRHDCSPELRICTA